MLDVRHSGQGDGFRGRRRSTPGDRAYPSGARNWLMALRNGLMALRAACESRESHDQSSGPAPEQTHYWPPFELTEPDWPNRHPRYIS
jgi:hypothetical protein